MAAVGSAEGAESIWAYPSHTGRMIYAPDVEGDRICDFTISGYNKGKNDIPDVPVVMTVYADGNSTDDTARLQAAIDQVAAMPLVNGFRGAILLKAGTYEIDSHITLNASGIVLRGEGQGDNGTILTARGTDQRQVASTFYNGLIAIDGNGDLSTSASATYSITDKTVPAGSNSFRVNSTSGLAVGNMIKITRPSTANWIADLGMDNASQMGEYVWKPNSTFESWERTITRIEGNRVFLDAPVTTAFSKEYGGATFQKAFSTNRINNVGIENLRGESQYASDTDEQHAWNFVSVTQAENVWVRDTTARYFARSHVQVYRQTKWVTISDCTYEMPKSQQTGGRRYAFDLYSSTQQSLVKNCTADEAICSFATTARVSGPNVFYNCTATNAHGTSGSHQQWCNGSLYDNVSVSTTETRNGPGELNAANRGNSSAGGGWTGANFVFWNCEAKGYRVQNPPTAQNWLIGSKGQLLGPFVSDPLGGGSRPSYRESSGPSASKVDTASLYEAQLEDVAAIRDYQWTGADGNWSDVQKWNQFCTPAVRNVEMRDYLIGDIDNMTYDNNSDDNYSIDPAFKTAVQNQLGGNIGGFDVVSTGRITAFTQQYALAPGEQVVNASLALAARPAGGSWSTDTLLIDGVGSQPMSSLKWGSSRKVGTTSVGMLDLGPNLGVVNSGKLSMAISGNTAADYALLSLQVGKEITDPQGASVTLSGGGTITVDSAVAAVGDVAVNDPATRLDIAGGGRLTLNNLSCSGELHVAPGENYGRLTVNENLALDGTYLCDIIGSAANTGYSQLSVSGSVDLDGLLTVNKSFGFTPNVADMFWLVLNDGLDSLVGMFDNYANGAAVFSAGGDQWRIFYGANSTTGLLTGGNDVVIAVPEPATWVMLLISCAAGLLFQAARGKL